MRKNISLVLLFTLLTWPATACNPDYVKQMEQLGQVTYAYYESKEDGFRQAHTQFKFSWRADLKYRSFVKPLRNGIRLIVVPEVKHLAVSVNHRVTLPHAYRDNPDDYRWLLYHEFDHVAISTDERPVLLFKHLAGKLKRFEHILPADATVDKALVNKMVQDEIDQYKTLVVNLIQANYERLDATEVSNHGKRHIPDRRAFFESLYSEENLKRMKFPHQRDVAGLLKTAAYRKAKRRYCTVGTGNP